MTALTCSQRDVDLVYAWLASRDNEKANVRAYHGDSPCIPAAAFLEVCRRIFSQPTTKQ
jgi:hypothetical protein